MIEFPEKVGRLKFVEEVDKRRDGERIGLYQCECGTRLKRTLTAIRSAKNQAYDSSCSKCRRKAQHRKIAPSMAARLGRNVK